MCRSTCPSRPPTLKRVRAPRCRAAGCSQPATRVGSTIQRPPRTGVGYSCLSPPVFRFSFRLGIGQVIPGIDQGVVGMRVGGRRRIVVPPDLGFGAQGTDSVPGNATLLFEVELVAGAEVPFEFTDLWVGEGEEVGSGDSLTVLYQGWLFDLLTRENKGTTFEWGRRGRPLLLHARSR